MGFLVALTSLAGAILWWAKRAAHRPSALSAVRELSVASSVLVTLLVFVQSVRIWMEWQVAGPEAPLPSIPSTLGTYSAMGGGFRTTFGRR